MKSQSSKTILKVENGAINLVMDEVGTCSIGLKTDKDCDFKYISKELHDLLIKELSD
jgi:hypothetical protein